MDRLQLWFKRNSLFEKGRSYPTEVRWLVLWGILLSLFAFFGITTDENGLMCVDENIQALIQSLLH